MKVAVTGASGHVGNALCRVLTGRGFYVKALMHHSSTNLQDSGIEIIKGDLLDPGSLEKLCRDAEIVFHLAARISISGKDREVVYRTNVQGTQNLTEVCLKFRTPRFIHFSSIHTREQFPLDQTLEETRPYLGHSKMVYEESKTAAEKVVLNATESGLNAVIMIPTAIIGPEDYRPSYLGQALIKIYKNALPMLVPGGYNWVDVRDVVECTMRAAEKGKPGACYIVSGHWESLENLSRLIGRITKRKTPSFIAPTLLARIGQPFISLYSKIRKEEPLYTMNSLSILKNSNRMISHSRATRDLEYYPRPLAETLKDTFDFYRQTNMIE
ncbi:MAG: NAD-dependent epimerase/dehydratase family protein [Bacteroidales bacterium]